MSLLPLWNNTFVLTLLLVTVVLGSASIAATRFRLSAATRNSILLPALLVAFVLPMTIVAARSAGWSVALPVLHASPGAGEPGQNRNSSGPTSESPNAATPIGAPEMPVGDRRAQRAADSPTVRDWAAPLTAGLLLVWGAGTAVFLVQLGRSYHALWRMLANARPISTPEVARSAERARAALGLPRYPNLLETDRVSSPVAVGTPRHGWVIWPENTLGRMPREQLEHVLLHEGAHIAQRDTSLRLVQGLIAAVWWWHPLVHVLNRQLSRTREELCDNAVLSAADPADYGQTLLDVERPTPSTRSPALAVTLFPEHERLEDRIKSLLNPRRRTMHRSKPSVLATAFVAGVAASALAGATQFTMAEYRSTLPSSAEWTEHAGRSVEREYLLTFEADSEPRHLDIDIKRGDILVSAYEGDAVLVRLSVPMPAPGSNDANGFGTVNATPIDFEVRQNGNFIELDGNSYEQTTHVEVFVPRQIDLTLDSYRAGVIRVSGVEGHIEARSQNNDIILTDVSGSADVYGYNGSFSAGFRRVTGDLEFETYNGNIDLALPADLQTTTYIRSDREPVQSQLQIATRPAEMVSTRHEDGGRSVDFGKYVVGDINGGGARTVIETTNGTIKIREF